MKTFLSACCALTFNFGAAPAEVLPDRDPAWTEAHLRPAMNAQETRAFMKTLARFVSDHHLKKTENSPQRGMIYEYLRVAHLGQDDAFIVGEALDTMHDGAWFAAAMVHAYRATGDAFYKEMLVKWQLPFYLRMLNHGDGIFTSDRNDARSGAEKGWQAGKEWLLQGREKGFVPYWWDDGAAVSLEMLVRKDELLSFPGRNEFAGRPNPQKKLSGWSHGSSNHLAQDLAVMLQQCWLLLRGSDDVVEKRLAGEIVEAARNLQDCRARHGAPNIPAVQAALALTSGDEALRRKLSDETWNSVATQKNAWFRALRQVPPEASISVPGFADDQEYRYYTSIARRGTLTAPAAFRLAWDAFTIPKLYQIYSDDSPVPPGIGVFDLHPYKFVNGRSADRRSERKGPSQRPRPIGSRFGPQNMIVCGWALQGFKAHPGLWEQARREITVSEIFPGESSDEVRAWLERELACGLRTWEAIFKTKGYIPTGLGTGSTGAGFTWDELSDTGGYAHLISAAAQWLLYLDGRSDWEAHRIPAPASGR